MRISDWSSDVCSSDRFSRTGELCPCGIAASSRADRSTGGSMQTVFEALGGARGRRPGRQTGQRVHRYSRTEEGREGRFWQPFKPKNVSRFMQAAEKYDRSEEHTSELQSLMRISYAVFCLNKKKNETTHNTQYSSTTQ